MTHPNVRSRTLRLVVLLTALALAAAACGQDQEQPVASAAGDATAEQESAGSDSGGDTAESAAPDHPASGGELSSTAGLQPAARDMRVTILSPADDTSVEGDVLPIHVAVRNFQLSPGLAGKESRAGTGHWHLYLDDSLVSMITEPTYDLSLRNLEPGTHTLRVVPAQNDHRELDGQGDEVTFDYHNESPPPFFVDTAFQGEPRVRILAPNAGDDVSGVFEIAVDVSNFNLSCDLLGKPSVRGYGHWHVNLDNSEGDMGGLLDMGCSDRIQVSTEGLRPGSIHTFYVTLTDNGHAPLGDRAQDSIQVRVAN